VILLFYNIQDPLDPQVNGFGFYRSIVDGAIPLLIERVPIGGRSTSTPSVAFALTHPWEAVDAGMNELVPVWTNPTQWGVNDNVSASVRIGATTAAQIRFTIDTTGVGGNLYIIQVRQSSGSDDAASASYFERTLTINLGTTASALDPAKNTATLIQAAVTVLAAGITATLVGAGTGSWDQTTIDESNYAFTGGQDPSVPQPCTSSNVWEVDPILHISSEHTYRVTQPWEHDFVEELTGADFTQTHITWAFASDFEDDELGAEVEYDNDPPVGNHLVATFQEHIFAAGAPDNPHYLHFSKRFLPEAFPTANFVEIGTANDPIQALVPIAGLLGVFTRDTKYRVSGNAQTGFTHYEAISRRGTRATKSVTPSDRGIIFVANDGVYTTNLIGPDTKLSGKIESLFTGDTVGDETPINQEAMDQVAATYYKNKYYFMYPSGDSEVPDHMAIYGFDTEEWAVYDIGGGSLLYEPDTDAMILGGDDGFISIMEAGTTDDGAAIEAEFRTKDFQGGSYNATNLFIYVKVDCEVANGTELTVTFYVDDELRHTVVIPYTAGRSNQLYGLPEGTYGTRWRVSGSFSDEHGATKLYGVAAVFIPLGSS